MKKFISIILITIMCLSIFTISGFAATSVTEKILQEYNTPPTVENCVTFYIDSKVATPGETVTLPVYMYSNYTPANDATFVQMGFQIYSSVLGEEGNIEVELADELKNFKGFQLALNHSIWIPEEEYQEKDENYKACYNRDAANFIFVADADILRQEKTHVADVTVKIPDNAWEDIDWAEIQGMTKADDETDEIFNIRQQQAYYEQIPTYTVSVSACQSFPSSIYDKGFYWLGDPQEGGSNYACGGVFNTEFNQEAFDANEELTPSESLFEVEMVNGYSKGQVSFHKAIIYPTEPAADWRQPLKNWFQKLLNDIMDWFDVIEEYIRTAISLIFGII